MAKPILFEEFHLTLLVPRGLHANEYDLVRRTLDTARFRADLRRGVRGVIRLYPALARIRFAITR